MRFPINPMAHEVQGNMSEIIILTLSFLNSCQEMVLFASLSLQIRRLQMWGIILSLCKGDIFITKAVFDFNPQSLISNLKIPCFWINLLE